MEEIYLRNADVGSPYKDILDGLVFSFSTLHQYDKCPYAFYQRKIDGSEINEGNFYSEAGSFIHDVNAQIFDGTLKIDRSEERRVGKECFSL